MTLKDKIEKAFAHRKMPAHAVEPEIVKRYVGDSDVEDALSFRGKDWREISVAHWNKHWCALFFLSREALAYYLPSLLLIPLLRPLDHMDMAIDSLIHELD